MQFLSFRNKLRLKKFLKVFLIVFAVVFFLVTFYLLYMNRYIVYMRDGAHVNTSWQDSISDSDEKVLMSVSPEITELEKTTTAAATSARRLSGCYITLDMLTSLSSVRDALSAGNYSAVMIEMKDGYGNFCYESSADPDAATVSNVDVSGLRSLISELKDNGVYLIAAIPAFADQTYCLNHIDLGLPLESGALWIDEDYCYWMDPTKNAAIAYIETVCRELGDLGFKEVVLTDYYIPTDDTIIFDESIHTRAEALTSAAQTLQSDLSSDDITVSFGISTTQVFPVSLSSGRFYFELSDPSMITSTESLVREYILSPEIQIVFLNNSSDTQFDSYGHLKPLATQSQ